jgi:hypothetical protein
MLYFVDVTDFSEEYQDEFPRIRDRIINIVAVPRVILVLLVLAALLLQLVCGHGAGCF